MSCQRFILSVRKLHLSILTTDCEEMQWINGSNAQARHTQQNKNKAFRHRARPTHLYHVGSLGPPFSREVQADFH